ncbi:MAG: hypothetical protein K2W84_01760 [Burkholderiales bacterium]|nr:hypothetical protein [Burkholderiales bacterium]
MTTLESAAHPRAAAQVLALTLLADGRLSAGERGVLQRSGICRCLGMTAGELDAVIQHYTCDLLVTRGPEWEGRCLPGAEVLRCVLSGVSDHAIRQQVFRLCVEIAEADGELSEGEFEVLAAALDEWGIHRHLLGCAVGDLNRRFES